MRIYYQLTTIDPVIVSQNSATTNNHECLDYIPGSAILGALAGQHYTQLSSEQSWQVFHNGDVKFSPCYPVVKKAGSHDQIALPTPASWHFAKGDEAIVNGQYNANSITNHASATFERDQQVQYKQCRDGYLTSQGDIAKVVQGNSTKTAIDRITGGAKGGKLFSYSYINENQYFVGYIESDNENLLNHLKTSLQQNMRIGRSRNSEFGRVKVTLIDVKTLSITTSANHELVIWCLSDCEIINTFGMPTLTPTGDDIHPSLAGANLLAQRSFIRSTRLSRFNQKRQGLDSEQRLICKGSVLTFKLAQPLTSEQLSQLALQGMGTNQQLGLGWIALNPDWAVQNVLLDKRLFSPYSLSSIEDDNSSKKSQASAFTSIKASPLTQWLSSQVTIKNNAINQQQTVDSLTKDIIKLYQNARNYNHILNSNEAGPSKTQWGRIREVLTNNNNHWQKEFFDGEQAICKGNNDALGWGIPLQGKAGQTCFSDAFKRLLIHENSPLDLATMRLLIEQLSRFDLSVHKDLRKAQKKLSAEGVAQ